MRLSTALSVPLLHKLPPNYVLDGQVAGLKQRYCEQYAINTQQPQLAAAAASAQLGNVHATAPTEAMLHHHSHHHLDASGCGCKETCSIIE